MLLNYYTNFLAGLIIKQYFTDHCLLIFTDSDFDFKDEIPAIKIKITNDSFDQNLIFHYFGCQGIIIFSDHPTPIFVKFEKESRLHMERFNSRRFLIMTENFENKFFELPELEFVSDLVFISSLNTQDEIIFELRTHKFVGTSNNNEPQLLDKWFSKNQTFFSGRNLYPDKLLNQFGRPLRMATFTYEPYSVIGNSVGEHQGSELVSGVVFGLKYNMTPVPIINERDYWGEIFSNWSGIGLLGNLVEDNADIGFSALYTWEICYHYLDLSKPLVRTGITCLVPAPKLAARWLTPLFSYTPELWFYVIAIFTCSIFILSLILYFYKKNKTMVSKYSTFKHSKSSAVEIATRIILKPVLLQSLSNSEYPVEVVSNFMMGLMLLFSLFLTSTYSSGLATVMTLPKYEDAIDTVDDFVRSEMDWGATQDGWIMSIQQAKEPKYVKIVNKFHPTPEEELRELSKTGKWAFSIERLPFENYAIGDYIKMDVIRNYHLMQEDLYWEQCVMMLRKNSILLPKLDLFILKIFEAGLISKWQSKAVQMYMDVEVQRVVDYYRHHKLEQEVVKLKWSHVEGAFAILAFGYGISLVIFILELTIKKEKL